MRRSLCLALLSSASLLWTGCERAPQNAVRPESQPFASADKATVAPSKAEPESKAVESPAATPPPVSATNPSRVTQPSIMLSTGVALAQTGLDGTMMTFSVDYEVQGELNTAGYVWVIERAQGQPARGNHQLARKGTLQAVIATGWRPEDGPFRSHLEDQRGNRVSESIEMLPTGG